MSDVVIKVEGVGKQYHLGQVGTGTISHDLNRWWYRVRGKEDPYLKIGETNDRSTKGSTDLVWALKDINFEVKRGEVIGIIGKNGAGKSTLLKILSRVTTPTVGEIKVKGRIASLLEVGTGFHPELTGRENIFLNGAILGMTKQEIRSKFDEIVDFSGVERYIDTPVKRYSSGMYVRLAFAVAAHLEPEILIVDEVLAVGDAEFQKKCLGKMKDVSGQGRTVLFVSHNMPSIRALCSTSIVMKNGSIIAIGETNAMIGAYLASTIEKAINDNGVIPDNRSNYNTGEAKFKKAFIRNKIGEMSKEIYFMESFQVFFELESEKDLSEIVITVFIVNAFGENVLMTINNEHFKPSELNKGIHQYEITFDEHLMPGEYSLGLAISNYHTGNSMDYIDSFYPFKVLKETSDNKLEYPWSTIHGYTLPKTTWKKIK